MNITRRSFLKTALSATAVSLTPALAVPLAFGKSSSVKEFKLSASRARVDLGAGEEFWAWTYNGRIPGPEIRVKEGDVVRVLLKNYLPEKTTIHWHGIPVPNPMDGVPGVTQEAVRPGESFLYEFEAAPPGTYVYHSHFGYQLDRGLYGPLIIEAKKEERSYDREYVIMLEDWATIDGAGPEASRRGMTAPGMGMMGMMRGGGFRAGEPLREPLYNECTINGKTFSSLPPLKVERGDRIRFRFINPSSSTIYNIRVAGHALTITHADGRPIEPFVTDVLRIGMGERYDAELHATNPGRWPIYNVRDNGPISGRLLASLLYRGIESKEYGGDGTLELNRINNYPLLEGRDDGYVKPVRKADASFSMILSGGMMGSPYWTINGRVYPDSEDIAVKEGDTIRLEYFNRSMMHHPMHLHGHSFEVVGSGRTSGTRIVKDTLIIPPHMGSGAIEFVADNPGPWLHHCHNLYHLNGGMANIVRVMK